MLVVKPEKPEKIEKKKVGTIDCPGFEGCASPICPLDKSFNKAAWYADEDICMVRTFRKEHWRIIQRKIKKVQAKHSVEGFFTLSLMEKMFRITGRVKGLTERQGVTNPQDIEDFLSKESGLGDGAEVEEGDDSEE